MKDEPQILRKLIELQVFDSEIQDLEQQFYSIPESLNSIKIRIQNLDDQFSKMNAVVSAQETELKQLAQEQADTSARFDKYQGQLMQVKTNKEYDAVLAEIENCQKVLRDNEEKQMEGQEKLEKLQLEKGKIEAECLKFKAEYVPLLQELETKYAIVKNEFDLKTADRQEKIASIPKTIFSRYEKIRKGTDGRAVVAIIRGSACGGCYQALPKHTINEILRNNRVINCEHCGRILYADETLG